MKQPLVGRTGRYSVRPGYRDSAEALGNTGVRVISTPTLIGWLEAAAHNALADALEEHEGSVGTEVRIKHLAAANLRDSVLAEAEILATENRRVRFAVAARQGDALVMQGTHERYVIDMERFMSRQDSAPPTRAVFWFDFHSPHAFLASLRVGELCRRLNIDLSWRPVQLAQLVGTGDEPGTVSARRWRRRDLQDWAALQGERIDYHEHYPLPTARALRAAIYAQRQGRAESFVQQVMRAYWQQQLDISNLDTLAEIGGRVGLERAPLLQVPDDERFGSALSEHNKQAEAARVFGVPSVTVGGRLYFGNDRLDMLERHALGGLLQEP